MEGVKSTSFLKFESMNDYVAGLSSFTEMLDQWVSKADNGYDRQYNIERHDDDLKFEVELTVTPHQS